MRTFLIIWFGQLISTLGSGLTSFAFGVWVYLETGSTTLFALNILSWTLPGILFSSLVGILVDRFDRRLILILSDVGSALTTLTVWALFTTGHLQVWHVYIVTFCSATFSNIQWTAQSAAVTMLVPRQHLGRASGMMAMCDAVSMLVSPALAGALYLPVGLGGIVLIDFVTFFFAVGTLLIVRIPATPPSAESLRIRNSFKENVLFGWKYIAVRPGLRGLLVYFAFLSFLLGMVDPLLQPMVLNLHGPMLTGFVMSSMGAGYLIGTLVMSAWGGPRRRALGILIPGVIQGVVMIGFGISPSLVVIAGSIFVFSLIDPIVGGSSQALWQSIVPADLQGRVFVVRWMISKIGLASSLILAGPLAEWVFEPLLLSNGILADSLGKIIGIGAGRGTGLQFIVLGVLFCLSSIMALCYAPLRLVDTCLPEQA